jgi:hypothetical protein
VAVVAVALCIASRAAHATTNEPSAREGARSEAHDPSHNSARAPAWHAEAWVTALLASPFSESRPLSDWGYGASLGVGARRARIPLTIGADLAGIHWGSVTVPEVLQLGDTPTRALVSIRQQTIFLDLWLRAQLPRGVVRPYVELVGGLKMIDQEYSLSFPDGSGATRVFDEATTPAWTLGAGIGLDLMLARATDDADSGLFVTLGVRHLWGNRVSIEHATYGTFDMDTDTLLFSVGFSVKTAIRRPAATH